MNGRILSDKSGAVVWLDHYQSAAGFLTRKKLRRGVHTSTKQLETDIRAFIERHNEKPKPYRWTKSADESSLGKHILQIPETCTKDL